MGKLKSPEEISRRFDPVTEADLGSVLEATDTPLKLALERARDAGLGFDGFAQMSLEVTTDSTETPLQSGSDDFWASEVPVVPPETPVPGSIAIQIAKRVESGSRFVDGGAPEPGKIVELYPNVTGEPMAVAQEPIPVLLDVLESNGKTWRGWVVARDRGYATCWDLILGPEEEDRDPLCEIVQAWNPVRVSLPVRIRILGKLSPHRLAALRMLAVDHENNFISGPPGEHRLGVALARELSDGTGVVTGTSIADPSDPRTEYQRIYREIAGKLPAPAQPSLAPKPLPGSPTLWERLFNLPAWQLGGAVATLLLAPLVVMLVMKSPPEQGEIAVAPPVLPQSVHRYAGTGETQQLRVADPEAKAQEIVEALRQIGALPETRSSWADMVSIRADLSKLPVADQSKALFPLGLAAPQDGVLKVDILREDLQQSQKDRGASRSEASRSEPRAK